MVDAIYKLKLLKTFWRVSVPSWSRSVSREVAYYGEVKWKEIHFPTVLCIFFFVFFFSSSLKRSSLLATYSPGSVGCLESWAREEFAKIIYNWEPAVTWKQRTIPCFIEEVPPSKLPDQLVASKHREDGQRFCSIPSKFRAVALVINIYALFVCSFVSGLYLEIKLTILLSKRRAFRYISNLIMMFKTVTIWVRWFVLDCVEKRINFFIFTFLVPHFITDPISHTTRMWIYT